MTLDTLIVAIIKIITAYLSGDFLVGIFHWIKDTYFSPQTPFIGQKLILPSRLHHIKPRQVTEQSNLSLFINSSTWTLWMLPFLVTSAFDTFYVALFLTIGLNDVIHKYAHMLDNERPYIINLLQKLYIIQAYDEHHLHHISPHEVNYCPITPYVNVLLEKINFWKFLEKIIELVTGYKPRDTGITVVSDG